MDMQSTEDCSNLPPQGFVLPQFIPLTPESVRLSLQRYQRQKRREQKAKELQKEQRRRRDEWKKNKADYQSDKSETENATFGHPALNPLEDGLMNSVSEEEDEEDASEIPSRANPLLATGKKLIPPLSSKFCARRYTGKPLQEMDDFYRYKRSFVVISSDQTIHRLSLSPALSIFGPFNLIRRVAIYIMVHPYPFQLFIHSFFHFTEPQVTFTVFYTCEAIIRVVGCGLIRNEFAYLRDAWNWLDFIVITLATTHPPSEVKSRFYENLGLKTIIGALMDAVMHLRDVAVLTLFMLSIFALIGVQLYRGTLLRKCVVPWPGFNSTVGGALLSQIATDVYNNKSFDPYLTTEIKNIFNGTFSSKQQSHFLSFCTKNVYNYSLTNTHCLLRDGNSTCPVDFICKQTRTGNPNFGYTNFDNFASALLCSFRLITQDYWESLYQLVIRWSFLNILQVLRANGPTHVFFFGMVIFLGSFYLLNIILAIVSMSYEQVCKQDMESDAQLAAAIELCAEDGAEQKKESVDSKKDLPMMNCIGFHITSTSRRHSIATTDFFTTTFTVEAFLKLIALGSKEYFADSWNIFDFAIVVFSLVEIPLTTIRGLSILRAFRLLRVFKLAKSWQTMKLLFSIVAMTLNALGNLTAVLMISIFVFAVLGMSLFGESYHQFKNVTRFPERCGKIPRWNFCDFTHSFMIVFRVLCGEWIESMWDCLEVNGWSCTIFFLMTMVLGNLVVLSLFLALLLSSFSAESFQKEEEPGDHNKLQEALDRIYRFAVWMRLNIQKVFTSRGRRSCCRSGSVLSKNLNHIEHGTQLIHLQPTSSKDMAGVDVVLQNPITLEDSLTAPELKFKSRSCGHAPGDVLLQIDSPDSPGGKISSIPMDIQETDATDGNAEETDDLEEILEAESVDMAVWEHPEDCFAPCIWNQISPLFKGFLDSKMGSVWRRLRQVCYCIVENRYFESFIFIMIIISSGTLALEDKHLPSRPRLKMALDYMDKLLTFIFLMEIILKWFAYGLRKFFSDAWCWLDFTIVTASSKLPFRCRGNYHSSTFRIKWKKKKKSGDGGNCRYKYDTELWKGGWEVEHEFLQGNANSASSEAAKGALTVGGNASGKFRKCVSEATGERLPADQYPNRTVCELHKKLYKNVSWDNSKINFDNVPNGFLALLQVATFKGWIEIMSDAVDITDYDQQPVYNNATSYYLFFVLFIIVGSFFTLNLFIGVIIQNFNMQKKKVRLMVGGSLELFMTEDQKKYYHAMKKMVRRTPQKPIPKPKVKTKWIFRVISNRNFDLFILGMIGLNTLIMCFEHHHQPETMKQTMEIVNKVFIIIFTCEFVLKLIGQRWYYFKDPWNIFDCCIVIFSLVCWGLEDLMTTLPVPPTTIRIVRLFRVGRVLRLVKSARGIRTLLFALIVSLPALFNVALLLFLTAFVYSIVGMSFFGKVAYYAGIDAEFNFETFPQAFIILLQISTSAGWSSVFEGLSNTDPAYCSQEEGTCGNFLWATLFLVSYLIISFMVIINMYIAVILENFSQATEDVQQGLTQDEFDAFYEIWELYDIHALGFIELQYLEEFVERIGPPLGIPRPNRIRLACLSIQICSQDRIFCMDLLDALTRNFLGRLTTEHPETLVEQIETGSSQNQDGTIDRTNFVAKAAKEPVVPISNTYERQRERMAAYKILYFWRSRRKLFQNCVKVEATDS
ncbi:unnamed protein product [Taenia asiatica]|uniref:Sodium channel protein n=1 Tax=Taenia asiatica TaxID=60517 RepID=A0A158R6N9_TAEAS|nr:unnamed protein product [Taenia asiatica]